MARKSSSRREFSIPGDELEQHRIQLEHNLQNTDLSLHLSSALDDDAGDNESLEYPRHGSAPDHLPAFASFDRHSRENIDLDASHIRAWSIREDEGIVPYDVRTMSTAAHHASAVTITTGLGRGGRTEPSISGAEYDPERPLQDIIAACHVDSDPDEANKSQDNSRPRLSETLHRVGFSPRRPRGTQPRGLQQRISDTTQRPTDVNVPRRNATSRARKITVSFDTSTTPVRRHVSQPPTIQPLVNIQPPTPSTSGSRFTKMARGLVRDVRQAQEQWQGDVAPVPVVGHRPVTKDGSNRHVSDDLNHEIRASKKLNRNRIHLPDVTGITNAIISPEKANLERYGVRGPGSKELEARLVGSLNALHTRLNHLETENSIARRRVRELEYELEECKRDVVRERTRLMENGVDVGAAPTSLPSTSRVKGKERPQKDVDYSSKYVEVVQEKKALEALIATLRSHLSRVTSDLTSQQQLLKELRSLRESDALSLTEKAQEISQLRTEVERLAGEIEVLRGVVEEGLNERRQGRDGDSGEWDRSQVDEPRHSPSPVLRSPEPSVRRFVGDEEIDRISVDLDERRSERASNLSTQSSASSPQEEEVARSPREGLDPERMENDCREDKDEGFDEGIESRPQSDYLRETIGIRRAHTVEEIIKKMDKNGGTLRPGDIPPQTVLARVIGELEEEFAHFREVYSKLAEEYRSLDCATQTAKRHVVGDRLHDVIEVLERKGNQIATLYDLLAFKDKPLES